MNYTRKKMLNRIWAAILSVAMVITMLPMNIAAENASGGEGTSDESTAAYGTVTTYTGGTVTGNGKEKVDVVIEKTTLQWVDEEPGVRSAGWWVGIGVTAPEVFSADATYKSKTNPTAEYGDEKSFAEKKDGDNYIQLWFSVTPESLAKFASEERNLTMTYAFDWNADGEYGQEITFSVKPS